jgi:hypothetical protein
MRQRPFPAMIIPFTSACSSIQLYCRCSLTRSPIAMGTK